MSTKDTTEVAGEFTIQVPILGTTFLSPCSVVTVILGFPALLVVSISPSALAQPSGLAC